MHVISYNSSTLLSNEGQATAAPPKYLLYAVTKIEKDRYTLTEHSEYCILNNIMAVTNITKLHSYII